MPHGSAVVRTTLSGVRTDSRAGVCMEDRRPQRRQIANRGSGPWREHPKEIFPELLHAVADHCDSNVDISFSAGELQAQSSHLVRIGQIELGRTRLFGRAHGDGDASL